MKLLWLLLLTPPVMVPAQNSVATNVADVRVWAMPTNEPRSADFKVEVAGQPVFVSVAHVAPADEKRRWQAMDDVARSAEFSISPLLPASTCAGRRNSFASLVVMR